LATTDELQLGQNATVEATAAISNLFRIISFSGGGIRGIYQVVYLQNLQKLLPGGITPHFELVAGTSTGSIIAAALACGIDLERVRKLYWDKGREIFSKRWFSKVRKGPHYRPEPLRRALESVFEDRTMKDCHHRLLIPATTLDTFECRVYKSYPENQQGLDLDARVVDAVMASCAAPTYFPAFKPQDDDRTYMDGGVWANAPLLVAAISAHKVLNIGFDRMRLLSVGNGRSPVGATAAELKNMRLLSEFAAKTVLGMMFEAQSSGAKVMAEMLLGDLNVVSIDSYTLKTIELDDVDAALSGLPGLAEQIAKLEFPKVARLIGLPPLWSAGTFAAEADGAEFQV